MIRQTKIQDKEFRDISKESKYPFTNNSTLCDDRGVSITTTAVIDCLLYSYIKCTPPFYLSNTSIKDSKLQITFKDSLSNDVGSVIIDPTKDVSTIFYNKIKVGTIVYNIEDMITLLNDTRKKEGIYFKKNIELLISKCITYDTPYFLSVNNLITKDIYIRASNGCKFTDIEGGVSLNMLGEEDARGLPILKINGVSVKDLWLASVPNSNVKVVTNNDIELRGICDVNR